MSTASRSSLRLDGTWQLRLPDGSETSVEVPGAWTAQVDGYGDSHDAALYVRRFSVTDTDADGAADRLFLCFDAVNHTAVVRVNGVQVGTHAGAWEPFALDVTDAVTVGENTLEVEVSYPPRYGSADEPGFLEHPVGKQSWYGTTAGIWQSVALERRHRVHLQELTVRADAATATITVTGQTGVAHADRAAVRVLRGGEPVASAALDVAGGVVTGAVAIDSPVLWDLDAPELYTVEVALFAGDVVVDTQRRETGFRTFTAEDGRFSLNGREVYLRAVLDQDYHPGGTSVPHDLDAWEDLLRQTKALGFNMLRVHIKRPDPRYYEIADRLGLLVWTELPSWMTWTREAAQNGHQLLRSLIDRDGHHPSIVVWTVMNESWGIDLTDPDQRAWLHETFDDIERHAAGSLVVDNSACEPNFHLRTHIDDYHVYRGIPETRRVWDAKIADFASRPDWTFSPYGDAVRTGAEPLVLSEFGNWGLPYALDQHGPDGAEPWWYALGADWAFGAAEGTGLMHRFRNLGLHDVFGSWGELVKQLHHAQLVANRYQTIGIRLHDEISGYVLTQLSDVQWEANGLFDMNRTAKAGTAEYALCNGEHAVALRPAAYSVFAGEELDVVVTTLPSPQGLPSGATLRIVVDGDAVHESAVGSGREECALRVALPGVHATHLVQAELWSGDTLLARDAADVIVVERQDAGIAPVRAGDEAVAAWLDDLGIAQSDDADLFVVRRFTDEARQHASAGGRVLLLAEEDGALGTAFDFLPSARLTSRAGDGDWVPRTEWLDRRGPFSCVPGDAVLGIAFEDLLGPLVISGIPGPLRPALVHSGIFSGWLRGAATSTATIRWSRGAVTLSTLRVREALRTVPVARAVSLGLLAAARG